MRRETPTNISKHCRVVITRPFSDPASSSGFVVAETGSHVLVTSEHNRVGEWFPLSSTSTTTTVYGH